MRAPVDRDTVELRLHEIDLVLGALVGGLGSHVALVVVTTAHRLDTVAVHGPLVRTVLQAVDAERARPIPDEVPDRPAQRSHHSEGKEHVDNQRQSGVAANPVNQRRPAVRAERAAVVRIHDAPSSVVVAGYVNRIIYLHIQPRRLSATEKNL